MDLDKYLSTLKGVGYISHLKAEDYLRDEYADAPAAKYSGRSYNPYDASYRPAQAGPYGGVPAAPQYGGYGYGGHHGYGGHGYGGHGYGGHGHPHGGYGAPRYGGYGY